MGHGNTTTVHQLVARRHVEVQRREPIVLRIHPRGRGAVTWRWSGGRNHPEGNQAVQQQKVGVNEPENQVEPWSVVVIACVFA